MVRVGPPEGDFEGRGPRTQKHGEGWAPKVGALRWAWLKMVRSSGVQVLRDSGFGQV